MRLGLPMLRETARTIRVLFFPCHHTPQTPLNLIVKVNLQEEREITENQERRTENG